MSSSFPGAAEEAVAAKLADPLGLEVEAAAAGVIDVVNNAMAEALRIVSVDKLGDAFTSEAVPLRYTPRRMAEHGTSGHLIVIEADHNAYNDDEKAQLYEAAQLTPPSPRRCTACGSRR